MKQWLTREDDGIYWISEGGIPTFIEESWRGVNSSYIECWDDAIFHLLRPDLKLPKGKKGICELKKIKGKLERVKR